MAVGGWQDGRLAFHGADSLKTLRLAGDNIVAVATTCTRCRCSRILRLDPGAWGRWLAYAALCFPTMPAAEQQQLATGICPPCQDP